MVKVSGERDEYSASLNVPEKLEVSVGVGGRGGGGQEINPHFCL